MTESYELHETDLRIIGDRLQEVRPDAIAKVRFRQGEDHDGDPAFFMEVLFRDSFVERLTIARGQAWGTGLLHPICALRAFLGPFELPYFVYESLRAESEDATLPEKERWG